jgi:hypothetical protein
MTLLHEVQRNFGMPIEIQVDIFVDRILPINTKWILNGTKRRGLAISKNEVSISGMQP